MEFKCSFCYSANGYGCLIDEANITEKDQVIKEFKGDHNEGKSHKDVRKVLFWKTNVKYFPRGLEKHFPDLTHLRIIGCGLKKISRNDLKGLERLVCLKIENCQLTSLPDDLFTEMPNLREVSFFSNKIEFASSEVLKPLLGRENVRVNFEKNKTIDACFWPGDEASTESLEDLMKLIDEKCMKPASSVIHHEHVKTALSKDSNPVDFNPKLKEMWLSGKFTDLTIIAGDKKFKVHKNILGMNNEMFAQIFEDQSEATEIKIPDFSSKAVEALFKFIYTNEISEDGDAKENLKIAESFKVAAMKSFYEKIICKQIDEENSWETFLFAHRFSSKQIKEKAFQQIARKFQQNLRDELMEDPAKLKKLIDAQNVYDDARRALDELLEAK